MKERLSSNRIGRGEPELFSLHCKNRYTFYLSKLTNLTRLQATVKRCSNGSGGRRRGEVPHLPVVKKYLSSHATTGTRGQVQNAITWSLSTHINKELSFVPMKLLFASMSLLQAKLSLIQLTSVTIRFHA